MSNLPQNPGGPTLNYQTPQRGPSKNRWWMILLRIMAGIVGGLVTGAMGLGLAGASDVPALFLLPPGIVLTILIVLFFKYKRVGYVTGFLLAPFVAMLAIFTILLIVCGSSLVKGP